MEVIITPIHFSILREKPLHKLLNISTINVLLFSASTAGLNSEKSTKRTFSHRLQLQASIYCR